MGRRRLRGFPAPGKGAAKRGASELLLRLTVALALVVGLVAFSYVGQHGHSHDGAANAAAHLHDTQISVSATKCAGHAHAVSETDSSFHCGSSVFLGSTMDALIPLMADRGRVDISRSTMRAIADVPDPPPPRV